MQGDIIHSTECGEKQSIQQRAGQHRAFGRVQGDIAHQPYCRANSAFNRVHGTIGQGQRVINLVSQAGLASHAHEGRLETGLCVAVRPMLRPLQWWDVSNDNVRELRRCAGVVRPVHLATGSLKGSQNCLLSQKRALWLVGNGTADAPVHVSPPQVGSLHLKPCCSPGERFARCRERRVESSSRVSGTKTFHECSDVFRSLQCAVSGRH